MAGQDTDHQSEEEDDELRQRVGMVIRDACSDKNEEWEMEKVDGEGAFGNEVKSANQRRVWLDDELAREEEQGQKDDGPDETE